MLDYYARDEFNRLVINRIVWLCGQISPMVITVLGCLIGIASGVFIGLDLAIVAAIALIVSGLFDVLDGSLALDDRSFHKENGSYP